MSARSEDERTSLPADLGIVVVNHGYPDLLERNLVGLGRGACSERVVVVDNFCGLDQREMTTALCMREGWTLLAPALDLGFAAAANAGVRLLRSRGFRRLLILSPEVRISKSGALALAEECAENPQCLLSPRIAHPDGSLWFGGGTVDVGRGLALADADADSSAPQGWLSGTCLMVHASLWEWLGGFEEDYFLCWEDIDLSWRCAAAGGAIAVRQDIVAVRSIEGVSGGVEVGVEARSPLYVYFNCRNRLAFAASHLGRARILAWLLLCPVYAAEVMSAARRRDPGCGRGTLALSALRGTLSGGVLALKRLCHDDTHQSRRSGLAAPQKTTAG